MITVQHKRGGLEVQVSITGRHIELSPEVRSYAEAKANKLTRFYDRIQSVEVILNGEGNGFEAEMVAKGKRKSTFVAKERGDDMYAAIDLVVDKIERQLTRHKEKMRNRKHPTNRGRTAEVEAGSTTDREDEDYEAE
jgi:putative sigma-54 modulation protein